MTKSTASLCALSALGSALCWLPILSVPSLDIPGWVSLALVAVFSGLSSALDHKYWVLFAICSVAGTTAGLFVGFMLWPIDPLIFDIGIFEAVCASVLSAVFASRLPAPGDALRRCFWGVLVVSAALGPLGLALTPPLVAHRIERNQRLAAERFASLQRAVGRAVAAGAELAQLCDGSALKRYSSGLVLSDEDWHRITGQGVQQDGYYFRIYCWEKGGFTIDGEPVKQGADGVQHFCNDETGKLGCRMERSGLREACALYTK